MRPGSYDLATATLELGPLTANATDVPMHWHGRHSLVSLLGKAVKLQVNLEGDAMLFALGFAPREAVGC